MGSLSAFRFAGTPAHARRSMAWYASMFDTGPVLDLGAGRGYFLEALKHRGIEGIGVDASLEAVAEGRLLGLDIVHEDAFMFLEHQTAVGGIFMSHLIEHFEPARAEILMQMAAAALRPGGTIVIVTPNPGDWLIMSDVFWLDPSHVRPYPRALLGAMLEAAGCRVEASGLRPLQLGRRRIPATILNRLRFGGQYGRGEAWIRARRTDLA